MPNTGKDLVDALRLRILSVWPEVEAGGIWPAEHADQIEWEKFKPPYAVVHTEKFTWRPEYGLTNHTEGGFVNIYYVTQIKGRVSGIAERLEALQDDLLHPWRYGGLAAGQVMGCREREWDSSLPINAIFTQKNMSHRAGRLVIECIIGVIL